VDVLVNRIDDLVAILLYKISELSKSTLSRFERQKMASVVSLLEVCVRLVQLLQGSILWLNAGS
jgi:hypothetical protein